MSPWLAGEGQGWDLIVITCTELHYSVIAVVQQELLSMAAGVFDGWLLAVVEEPYQQAGAWQRVQYQPRVHQACAGHDAETAGYSGCCRCQ